MTAPPPLVLDLDGSVGPLPGERRLDLRAWQERLRFGCSRAELHRFATWLDRAQAGAAPHGTVFLGSGDFHHLSAPLVAAALTRAPARQPVRVLVFDNHPDNMRFPWGVHCGSWVRDVAALPGVARVDVVGITSGDVGWAHAWENCWAPLRSGRVHYWSVGVDGGWTRWIGAGGAARDFPDLERLVDALCAELRPQPLPVYLSIDKDVFAPALVRTNWDQGRMLEHHLEAVLGAVGAPLVGSDITGDVSAYRYATAWKRWLSRADAQDTQIDATTLAAWQSAQHRFNARLLRRLQLLHLPAAAAEATP
jgi:hypothetical protein